MSHTIAFSCLAIMAVIAFLWWVMRSRDEAVDGRVVAFLRQVPNASGARLSVLMGIGSGRLYPALARLERDGIIVGEWEGDGNPIPPIQGVARRRLYRVKEKQ